MSHSTRVRAADLQGIYRLLRESCELGEDAYRWRAHVLEGIDRLLGIRMGMMFVGRLPVDPASVNPKVFVGWQIEPHWAKYGSHFDVRPDPCTSWVIARLHKGFASIRQHMCDDREWYRSEYFNEVLRVGQLDHYLMSVVALPEQQLYSTFGLVGRLGDGPYGPREMKMLAILHTELAMLWRTPVLTPTPEWRRSLSPRLAQVLDRLERGQSEKQIAISLGISRPTIHNHITRLHRLLDVNSRGELLAKSRVAPTFRPRLLPELDQPVLVLSQS